MSFAVSRATAIIGAIPVNERVVVDGAWVLTSPAMDELLAKYTEVPIETMKLGLVDLDAEGRLNSRYGDRLRRRISTHIWIVQFGSVNFIATSAVCHDMFVIGWKRWNRNVRFDRDDSPPNPSERFEGAIFHGTREWFQRCQQDRVSKLMSPFAPIVEIGPTATLPGPGPGRRS